MALDPIGEAMHRLCSALHMERLDPAGIEIVLPWDAWWAMWNRLEQLHPGIMKFDGRGHEERDFRYMGVTFKWKDRRGRA